MITIQSFMLVALGFLFAVLIGLLLLPAYRRRTVRLTTDKLKRSMPLTEAEIRADKDRIRADYAILIHNLEAKLETATLAAARQRVEINRRDAVISGLEGEMGSLRTSLEEHENARHVLEQTITDRLPRVEQRLAEARKLLTQRDREIAKLSETATKQARALEEAMQINTHNRDEIHRLNAALATRAARSRNGIGDQRIEGEVALRSEIEALRAKTRDQAALIARLQGLIGRTGGTMGAGVGIGPPDAVPRAGVAARLAGEGAQEPIVVHRAEDEIARLRNDLAEAEAALRSLRNTAEAGEASRDELAGEVKALKAVNDAQAAEVAQLKAALKVFEGGETGDRAIFESKMSLKAKVASLTSQAEEQSHTIQRLRAEIAAANERTARQAAHFTEELRRLGSGTYQTTVGRRTGPPELPAEQRKSLSERIAEPRPAARKPATGGSGATPRDMARASGFLRALGGGAEAGGSAAEPPVAQAVSGAATVGEVMPQQTLPGELAEPQAAAGEHATIVAMAGQAGGQVAGPVRPPPVPQQQVAQVAQVAQPTPSVSGGKQPAPRRGGLLDRITRIDPTD